MNNSQDVANLIKTMSKSKKIAIGTLLSECELSKNTLSSMQSGGYYPRIEAICKIADHLDCSVDYLLGRTDDPELHKLEKGSIVIHPAKEETTSYKLAAYGGKNEVTEDEDEPKTT